MEFLNEKGNSVFRILFESLPAFRSGIRRRRGDRTL